MMENIEIEVKCKSQEAAAELTNSLQNGDSWVGVKHGEWILFISCPQDRILYLGQELHYALT